ncbi:hypothetical protein P7C70_g8412, partial [Phenoliferia sp. Uapishka_3]
AEDLSAKELGVRAPDGRPIAKLPQGKGPTAKRRAINEARRAKLDPIQRGIFDRSVCMHTTFAKGFRPETHINGAPLAIPLPTPPPSLAIPSHLPSPPSSSSSITTSLPSPSSSSTQPSTSGTLSRPSFILGALPAGPRPVAVSSPTPIASPSCDLSPGSPMQCSPAQTSSPGSSQLPSPMAVDSLATTPRHRLSPPASPTPQRATLTAKFPSAPSTSTSSLSSSAPPLIKSTKAYSPEARWTRQHALGARALLSPFETTWIVITDLPKPDPLRCCSNCNPNLLAPYEATTPSHEERKAFPDMVLILKARRAKTTSDEDREILRTRLLEYQMSEYTRLVKKSKSVYLEWVLETATITALSLHCGRFRGNFVLDRAEVGSYLKEKHGIKTEMMPAVVGILEGWRAEVEERSQQARDLKEKLDVAVKAKAKAKAAAEKEEAKKKEAEAALAALAAKKVRSRVPKGQSVWATAGKMEDSVTQYKARGVRKNLRN